MDAYYRSASEQALVASERHDGDTKPTYLALSWESLSDEAKRPWRTAVCHVLDVMPHLL